MFFDFFVPVILVLGAVFAIILVWYIFHPTKGDIS